MDYDRHSVDATVYYNGSSVVFDKNLTKNATNFKIYFDWSWKIEFIIEFLRALFMGYYFLWVVSEI